MCVHTHRFLFDSRGASSDGCASELERRATAGALAVIRAIDVNHEALRGSQEICDEAPEQWHLPAKDDAQAAPANLSPEELFSSRWRAAQQAGALSEKRRRKIDHWDVPPQSARLFAAARQLRSPLLRKYGEMAGSLRGTGFAVG